MQAHHKQILAMLAEYKSNLSKSLQTKMKTTMEPNPMNENWDNKFVDTPRDWTVDRVTEV